MIIRSRAPPQHLLDHGADIRELVKIFERRHSAADYSVELFVRFLDRLRKGDKAQDQTVECELGGIY
jgi:hypothetical protein